jgi:hypothetical protein
MSVTGLLAKHATLKVRLVLLRSNQHSVFNFAHKIQHHDES